MNQHESTNVSITKPSKFGQHPRCHWCEATRPSPLPDGDVGQSGWKARCNTGKPDKSTFSNSLFMVYVHHGDVFSNHMSYNDTVLFDALFQPVSSQATAMTSNWSSWISGTCFISVATCNILQNLGMIHHVVGCPYQLVHNKRSEAFHKLRRVAPPLNATWARS